MINVIFNPMRGYIIAMTFLLLIACGKEFTKTSKEISTQEQPVTIEELPKQDNVTPTNGSFTGVDLMGNSRTCKDQQAVMICTSVFTQSDAFANKCRQNGHKAVMCKCHDWICVK